MLLPHLIGLQICRTRDFRDDAARFRIISLTDNLPWITATANDFGYDKVFENQLKNLLREEDLVVAISSSGNSQNIIRAIEYANSRNATTVGVGWFRRGKTGRLCKQNRKHPNEGGALRLYGGMQPQYLVTSSLSIFMKWISSDFHDHHKLCTKYNSFKIMLID